MATPDLPNLEWSQFVIDALGSAVFKFMALGFMIGLANKLLPTKHKE